MTQHSRVPLGDMTLLRNMGPAFAQGLPSGPTEPSLGHLGHFRSNFLSRILVLHLICIISMRILSLFWLLYYFPLHRCSTYTSVHTVISSWHPLGRGPRLTQHVGSSTNYTCGWIDFKESPRWHRSSEYLDSGQVFSFSWL